MIFACADVCEEAFGSRRLEVKHKGDQDMTMTHLDKSVAEQSEEASDQKARELRQKQREMRREQRRLALEKFIRLKERGARTTNREDGKSQEFFPLGWSTDEFDSDAASSTEMNEANKPDMEQGDLVRPENNTKSDFATQRARLLQDADNIFEDVTEEYSSLLPLKDLLERWKTRYSLVSLRCNVFGGIVIFSSHFLQIPWNFLGRLYFVVCADGNGSSRSTGGFELAASVATNL